MISLNSNDTKRLRAIRHAESDALFATIADGVISVDEQNVVTRMNKSSLNILAINNADEVIGKKLDEVLSIVDDKFNPNDNTLKPISYVFETGNPIIKNSFKIKRKRGDDPILTIEGSISPMKQKNKVIGAILIFRDVSDEDRIDQMKNDFISLASHQLRTPLSSISVYAHMLVDGYVGKVNDDQVKYIKTIIKSANRMNGVISSLTDIAKLNNDAVKFAPKKTNISQILEGVFHENRVSLEEKNITYKNLTDKNSPVTIITDPILTTEIINNLASNAIKYTPDGGTVTAKAIIDNDKAVIEITDNGIGIDKKNYDKIFDKFFRAPGVTKHDTFGSGLGLYIVKGFLDIVGGSVIIDSKINEGTKFTVLIPSMPKDKVSL